MRILATAAAAALLGAGAASAQTAMASPSGMAAMSTPQYLAAAGASDKFEITEGRLAQSMGHSSKVKSFGAEMITDHTKSTQMLMAAAHKAGMNPSAPMLTPAQQQMVSTLKATHGADFDRTYVQQQMQSHEQALATHQAYAQGGSNKTIAATSQKIVPVVQKHIDQLQSMSSGMAAR